VVWDFEVLEYHNYFAGGVIHHNSGKSHANIGFDLCAFALGLHPFRHTPEKALIWAATNTWDGVGQLLWKQKIKQFLPKARIHDIVWHNKHEKIPKAILLKSGVVIEFKAFAQGREEFQGRAIHAFYQDEQCEHNSEGIQKEVEFRLLDYDGAFFAASMTPILFQDWLDKRLRDLPNTDEVFYADLEDNRKSRGGHIPDEAIDDQIAKCPDEVRETRIKGYMASFAGAVYKTFNRDTHVIEPFPIPSNWTLWRSIDWGFNNPFCCLWLAQDPDGRWYVYHEHYQSRERLADHAERIKQISGRQRYAATWADHDAQDRYEFQNLGIRTMPAKKDVHRGIEAVQAAMKIQGDNRPRLYIFSHCENTIREIMGYRYAEGTETRSAKDDPIKVDDHAVDALRYGIFGVDGSLYFSKSDLS